MGRAYGSKSAPSNYPHKDQSPSWCSNCIGTAKPLALHLVLLTS